MSKIYLAPFHIIYENKERFKEFISISLHKISLHTMLTAKNKQKDIEEMTKGQKRPEWAIP